MPKLREPNIIMEPMTEAPDGELRVAAVAALPEPPKPTVYPASIFGPARAATANSHSHDTAAVTTKKLTEFTYFPKIPLELRIKVYSLAMIARLVNFTTGGGRAHALSLVCKEARQEYKRQYTRMEQQLWYIGKPFWFYWFINCKIDILDLSHVPERRRGHLELFNHLDALKQYKDRMVNVQRAAVRLAEGGLRMQVVTSPAFGKIHRFWSALNTLCPNLKELNFIVSDRVFGLTLEHMVECEHFEDKMGVGQTNLRDSFGAAQKIGHCKSVNLKFMAPRRNYVGYNWDG